MAFEWPPEWPERFRIVNPNYGVLRSRGPTGRREQLARRGDADGDGLETSYGIRWGRKQQRRFKKTHLVAVAEHFFYLWP